MTQEHGVKDELRRLRSWCVAGLLLIPTGCVARGPAADARPEGAAPREFETAAVAADHPLASRAGVEILRRGGNAVDAAVAVSFCLSVVRPYSCGIGGGGFMVIHLPDDPRHGRVSVALDYRERAPRAVGPDHFSGLPPGSSQHSGHAVAVPGTVAGLMQALQRYGTLDRRAVLQPAIRAAREGFALDAHTAEVVQSWRGALARRRDPDALHRAVFLSHFLDPDGVARVGHIVRLPEQARALELIAEQGPAAFYEGPIARAMVLAVGQRGGVLDGQDLRDFRVQEVEPLSAEIFGRRFLTMPPPSSGGLALLQILGILEANFRINERYWAAAGSGGVPQHHAFAEAMKHAFADRARWLGDPEFVDIPLDALLEEAYLQDAARAFDAQRTHPPQHYGKLLPTAPDGGTSHLCVVDPHGGAVACTETINLSFGSHIVVPGFGFCLNNEMDDFLTRPGEPNAFGLQQSERNLPAPGKRPLSSMSPTIVVGPDGAVLAVAGGSGGPRIISATAQVLLHAVKWQRDAEHSVRSPRIHHQWMPDVLYVERARRPDGLAIDDGEIRPLELLGHQVVATPDVGVVQLIRRGARGWQAASDPRKGGRAAGY